MRRLTGIFVFLSLTVFGQQAEPILFQEKLFDFGDVLEKGGHVEHEFLFTNNSGRPIKILSVQASCGCTTPGWTKEVIAPGGTAFVKASFDPKGRPGYFNKSLTVTTDFDGTAIALQIKGQVIDEKVDDSPTDYPAESGNLRLKFNSFPLGKVFINRKASPKAFPVYNAGPKLINISTKVIGPTYITVEVPKTIKPKETGMIRISYDAKARNLYGFVSDNVEITTDDERQPIKSFSVYATVEESIPVLTAAEMASAPILELELSAVDIGRIRQGNMMSRDITIKNSGKKELQIRALQSNCSCVSAVLDPMKLKPGEVAKLKFTLNTSGRTGLQQKAITIYSNDPKNPVQRVTIQGYIDQ